MPGIVTSVRIDAEVDLALRTKAHQTGSTFNALVNKACKAYVGIDSTTTEETDKAIRALVQERDEKILGAVANAAEVEKMDRETALNDLQTYWNLYLSTGAKPLEAKLNWVASRRERYPALRSIDAQALLKELEG